MSIKKPILLDLPMPIMTGRLVIKPIQPGMGQIAYDCFAESFDDFHPYFGWAKQPPVLADSEEFARRSYASFILREAFHMGVFADDVLVAGLSFHEVDWRIGAADIGYWCRTSEAGQGYMTEAVKAWTRYGFDVLKFRRITIHCQDINTKSAGVAERAGFALEARTFGLRAAVLNDDLIMSRRYVRFDAKGLEDITVNW